MFYGQFAATIGDCEGLLQLKVIEKSRAPNLYSAPMPPGMPNFVLDRQFDGADCPAVNGSCGDQFVVQIHPVD